MLVRRLVVLVVLVGVLAVCQATAHAAGRAVVLKLATTAPAGSPWKGLVEEYRKNVEARAAGRLKVKLLAGVDEGDAVARCRAGRVQATLVSAGALAATVPEVGVVEVPFLFRDDAEADDVIDHLLGPALGPVLRESGLVLGFWGEAGFRHFARRDRAVRSPADLAGRKMRAEESPLHLEMYKNLGAQPVPVPGREVVPALESGALDGFDQSLGAMIAAGWTRTIRFVTLSRHSYRPSLLVFNRAWFEALPTDLQTILLEEGHALETRGRNQVRALVPRQVKALTDAGIQVHEPSAPERDAFEQATAPGRQSFRRASGKRTARLLDDVEARLAAARRK